MIKIGIIGIGRIGKIHLENLCTRISGVKVLAAMNPSEAGRAYAAQLNVPLVTANADEVLHHPEIDAVLICTSTNMHAEYIIRAAKAGKAIFCEKPIDLSLEKVKETLREVKDCNVPLMLAFNQRVDPNFNEIKSSIEAGKLGTLRSIHIISRDPAPPPVSYIKLSGGLFLDMTIHDFDMANYLVNDEVEEVYAKGFNLIDPAIGEAGDIDSGYVLLTYKNKVTVIIENSRQAAYGYDQRIEVFGSKGMMKAENPLKTTNQFLDGNGVHLSRNLDFFIDRYETSYLLEMKAFIEALQQQKPMPISGDDGLKAMLLALAANKSMQENRVVKMDEFINSPN
jgi:myo-inositol 2-dehydrogenase/D-chiro-inositol 1-dehydrogenase